MVVSGFVAWRRRVKRRVEEGSELYRSAASSLQTRARKKLTSKEDWYKGRRNKRKRDEFDQPEGVKKKKKKKEENIAENKDRTVSVMFVPFTKGGELEKQKRLAEANWRENKDSGENWTETGGCSPQSRPVARPRLW